MNAHSTELAPEAGRLEAAQLAALIGSRLCHDIVSPLGAIGNGLELLQISDQFPGLAKSPELQLIAESVEAARIRIKWFRMAFGHVAADQRLACNELSALFREIERGGRLRVTLDCTGDLPRTEARMILLALMCVETAMPWGGQVQIARTATGWRLQAEASRTRQMPALWAWLDGTHGPSVAEPPPAEVHFPLLAAFARDHGREISWSVGENRAELAF